MQQFNNVLQSYLRYRSILPPRSALRIALSEKRNRNIVVRVSGREVLLRGGTSDVECFQKVFLNHEYRSPFEADQPATIVDAGANVGLATVYFARTYPKAHIVAIEPADSNFQLLEHNCRNLKNVTLLKAALWSQRKAISISNPTGEEWAYVVSEPPHEPQAAVSGITISDLLASMPGGRIDFLKLDIEGAELEVLSAPDARDWIDKVGQIAIELHDRFRPGCARAFYELLQGSAFSQEVRGENVFVKLLHAE